MKTPSLHQTMFALSSRITQQRGVALVELMLSFSVLLVLALGVLHVYQLVDRDRRVNHALTQLQALRVAAIHDVARGVPSPGDALQPWISRGQLPVDFVQRANPWGGGLRALWLDARHMRVQLDHVPAQSGRLLVASLNHPIAGVDAKRQSHSVAITYDVLA